MCVCCQKILANAMGGGPHQGPRGWEPDTENDGARRVGGPKCGGPEGVGALRIGGPNPKKVGARKRSVRERGPGGRRGLVEARKNNTNAGTRKIVQKKENTERKKQKVCTFDKVKI